MVVMKPGVGRRQGVLWFVGGWGEERGGVGWVGGRRGVGWGWVGGGRVATILNKCHFCLICDPAPGLEPKPNVVGAEKRRKTEDGKEEQRDVDFV
jgi:hypothetical protein